MGYRLLRSSEGRKIRTVAMENQQNEVINNITAIKNSLKTDRYVFRWFTNLILRPRIRERLKCIDNVDELYKNLRANLFKQRISFIFLLLLALFFIAADQFMYVIIGLLFLSLYILYRRRTNDFIVQISSILLSEDFAKKDKRIISLYQITEFYGSKYKVPSLIDVLNALDNIGMVALFTGAILIRIISPVKIPALNRFLLIGAMFAAAYFIANLPFFYNRLK